MRLAALGLLVCVVACGNTPHRASTSTAVPIDSAPAASSARSGTEPTPVPLDAVDFSCRLPVDLVTDSGNRQSAFLPLPGRALIGAASNEADYAGGYYDGAVGRWLPVPGGEVEPDGRRYVDVQQGAEGTASAARVPARIRVIDAATGATLRVVEMPGAVYWGVYDFAAAGIEAYVVGPGIGAPLAGVWNVNPDTGVVTKVTDGYDPPSARWIRDRSDTKVFHRDSAGHTTTWVDMPGYGLGFIPFAGDSALLVAATWSHPDRNPSVGADLWLVRGPGDATKLLSNVYPPVYGPGGNIPGNPYWYMVQEVAYSTGVGSYSNSIVDEHGIWLAFAMLADNGPGYVGALFLVTPAGAILHVDDRALFPAGTCA